MMSFPVGIVMNVLAVAVGGIIGTAVGPHMTEDFKRDLNAIFGVSSMAMGVASIVLMQNLPAVVFAVIIGTAIGLLLQLGKRLERGGARLQKRLDHGASERDTAGLVTAIVLFCASGTGIYGSIASGISGDHSILITKAILDLFTAMIFAGSLGKTVALIAVPQFCVFMLLYLLSGVIMPLTTPVMINDFKACGGIIMLATGFRIAKIKQFPITDMLPAMILVMPISWMWVTLIAPLL